MKQQTTIYICDVNKIITLKPGSRYTLLLWKVIDTRLKYKERGNLIHHARRYYPENTNHYYFTSPKAAAKYFGWRYKADAFNVEEFYERRDILLNELGLKYDSWWESSRFDYVTTMVLRPMKPYELQNEIIKDEDGNYVIRLPDEDEENNKKRRRGGKKNYGRNTLQQQQEVVGGEEELIIM